MHIDKIFTRLHYISPLGTEIQERHGLVGFALHGQGNKAGRLCTFDRCGWGVLLSHLKSVHFHAVRALLFTDGAFCKDFSS